ncbi:DUF1707 domain-containing protein [Plantactinospora sp. GCM10030261]|uniref:DUF1707 SHOCT-like domain-containing protein n=1 Tax=Plantactinospora sp. GCM10030261 TaxID=3273420 RepID=UPI003620FB62
MHQHDALSNPNERVGTAQRTAAADQLSKALAEGFLDLEEYDQRTVAVHSAVTVGDIVRHLADLPPRFHWDPRSSPPAVATPAAPVGDRRGMATAALLLALMALPASICYGFGGILSLAALPLGFRALKSKEAHGMALASLLVAGFGVVSALFFLFILVVWDSPTSPPTP